MALALIAAALLSPAVKVGLAFGQSTATASEEVKRLGRGYDDQQIVANLARTPQLSVRVLIQQLHPVEETQILASQRKPDAEHVLWCIRALRYLTGGKDFCGSTSHRFGRSELERHRRFWLYFGHRRCVSFFAMWPSRGTEYIAPEDAQEQIIAEWKRWFAKEGASFDYKPLQHPKPEQWLW